MKTREPYVWATDTASDNGYEALVHFQVPEDDLAVEVRNESVGHWTVARKVDPEDILSVHVPWPDTFGVEGGQAEPGRISVRSDVARQIKGMHQEYVEAALEGGFTVPPRVLNECRLAARDKTASFPLNLPGKWGWVAAGALLICGNYYLMQRRGSQVMGGAGTLSVPGGRIDLTQEEIEKYSRGEIPESELEDMALDTAYKEVEEEVGHLVRSDTTRERKYDYLYKEPVPNVGYMYHDEWVEEDFEFRFYTFGIRVPDGWEPSGAGEEFEWESAGLEWVKFGDSPPGEVHPGFAEYSRTVKL